MSASAPPMPLFVPANTQGVVSLATHVHVGPHILPHWMCMPIQEVSTPHIHIAPPAPLLLHTNIGGVVCGLGFTGSPLVFTTMLKRPV